MNANCEKQKDEDLVLSVLKNRDCFLYIVERYQEKLFRYIRRISALSEEDIEDLLQEIFIKVYKNLNDFDTSLKFSSWIYRIAHNEVISNFRKIKARPQKVWDDENLLLNIASKLDFVRDLDNEFLQKNINEILEQMDLKYREVLVLKFLEERSYKEISDILKKPVSTVGTMINRAKKQFLLISKKKNNKGTLNFGKFL